MARTKKSTPAVAPPEVPEAGPEQAEEKQGAIASDDAPAGAVETAEVPEPGTPDEDVPPVPVEADEPSGQDEPMDEPTVERPEEPPPGVKTIPFGVHDGYVIVDRPEFAKLIKQLTYGQPFDPYGIMAMLQKMLHLGTWDEAKKVTETLMMKG